MKRILLSLISVSLSLALCACGNPDAQNVTSTPEQSATNKPEIQQSIAVSQELETIPEAYFSPAEEQGTLVELYYTTYESTTYEQKTQELEKRAIVYLPCGYNEDVKYNVFYLMHGGWGNETTHL